jgi:amidase
MSGFPEYTSYDGVGLAELIRRKEVKPMEVVEAAIDVIERHNQVLNAVIYKRYEAARMEARGSASAPLAGVPILMKDLGANCAGVPYTAGSKVLKDYVPNHDSEHTARLKRAGLIILGITNVPELGFNASTEPDLYGPTHNPWNVALTPGGSSGGSAAAVAAGMVPIAHATDGGGSIRVPAAACGLFGLKPTRLRNPWGPDAGDVLFGLAVQHVVTRSVRDSAAVLDATEGTESGAPYAAPPKDRPFLQEVGANPGKLRIAFATATHSGAAVHADCVKAVEEAATLCAELGHQVEEKAPRFQEKDSAPRLFTLLVSALHAALLNDFTRMLGHEVRIEEFETSTRASIEYGREISAVDLIHALDTVHRLGRESARFMRDYDVLLTPTTASPPISLGKLAPHNPDLDDHRANVFGYAAFTPVANFTGQPAMSVPLAQSADNLPIGVHFTARFGDEATLFRLASQLEQARPWSERRPEIYG